MGLVQFVKDRNRIHQAGKAGKLETEIQQYQSKPHKTDEDWKHLSKLTEKKSKIIESNKIKSERNRITKFSNTSIGVNFKGSQQVGAQQDNTKAPKKSKN